MTASLLQRFCITFSTLLFLGQGPGRSPGGFRRLAPAPYEP
jgi:hypothetical protein